MRNTVGFSSSWSVLRVLRQLVLVCVVVCSAWQPSDSTIVLAFSTTTTTTSTARQRSATIAKAPTFLSPSLIQIRHQQQQQQQQGVKSNKNNNKLTRCNMFTGIVEEMGTVLKLDERNDMTLWDGSIGSGTELHLQSNDGVVMKDAYLGCSICVSGVCLTVTEFDVEKNSFKVGLAPETLRKSHLGSLQTGSLVNLERASEIGGRNSGHFVQGHVDGTGTIIDRWVDEDSLFFKVQLNRDDTIQYIVPKGFVAVDGTSLTVVDVDTTQKWFTFMLVAYTQKKIIVPSKQVGDLVNIEVDVLGKYSESVLAAFLPRLEALEAKVASLEKQLQAPSS